ncbi:MAG: flagellar hook-length control protein FliK [Lachnospiraceae bacterium]|nr:flagellar hook-length control protein FliK [Lachnospiraceae bacterium]
MRLTEIFSADKQVTDKQRTEQTDVTKTVALNRQIKSMVPGQTIQGEIVSKNGGEIQIRLLDDLIINARLEHNMNLEMGRSMTFEVRNNGRALTLSPLFANTATDANTFKALDMALLPANETTVKMTGLMMDAGLPVDKNTLQQVYREINLFSEAGLSDIVDLHRLSLPVNAENLEQLASYKNLTHQILDGMTEIANELDNIINFMTDSGDVKSAAGLYSDILSLAGENASEPPEMTNNAALMGEAGKSAAEQALSLLEEIASGQENAVPLKAEGGNYLPSDNALSEGTALSEAAGETNTELAKSLSRITGQTIMPQTGQGTLIKMADELLQRAISDNDIDLLSRLLGDTALKKAVNESLLNLWTLKPEEVADSGRVEEFYGRLGRQLRSLSQALENSGQTTQNAYRAVNNMTQNIDFLQQLNQTYAYVQLPLRLNQGNAHGELYVYTNKRNLSAKEGKVSALLHLDMEYLGSVDVYVTLEASNVSTKFYVEDDDTLDFLSEHMDILTSRLEKRGYNCTFGLQTRDTEEENEGGVRTLLKQTGHTALVQYAFDVRA